MSLVCGAAAIFWFENLFWLIGSWIVCGLTVLLAVTFCIGNVKALRQRKGEGGLLRRDTAAEASSETSADAPEKLQSQPAPPPAAGGANALAALFNNMSDQGAAEFAKLLNQSTPEDAEKLGRKLSTSSEADVKAMAQALNAGGEPVVPAALPGTDDPGPDVRVGATRKLDGHRDTVKCLAFTPDSRTLISAEQGYDAKLILWDLPEGRAAHTRVVGNWVEGLCISDDGKTLVAYSQSKRVYAFRLPGAEPLRDFDPHDEFISAIALSPDGRMLATGVKYKPMQPKLWSLPEGKLLHTFPKPVRTRALQFSPDGRLLACAVDDEPPSLWSVPDGKHVKTLATEVGSVYTNCFGFSSDGDILVTGDGSNKIRFIKVDSGRLMCSFTAHVHYHYLAFSPDRKLVVGSGENNSVVVWRLSDGRELCVLHGHAETGLHMAISNEPRVLVSSGTHLHHKKDHSFRVWIIPHGKPVAVLDDPALPPHAVAVSPDGRFVAFAPDNEPIRLLELAVQSSADALEQPQSQPAESTPPAGAPHDEQVALDDNKVANTVPATTNTAQATATKGADNMTTSARLMRLADPAHPARTQLDAAERIIDPCVQVREGGASSGPTGDLLEKTVAQLDQALALCIEDPDLLLAKARLLQSAAQFKSAEAILDRVLTLSPDHFEAVMWKRHWESWTGPFSFPKWDQQQRTLHTAIAASLKRDQRVQVVRDGLQKTLAIVTSVQGPPFDPHTQVNVEWVLSQTPYGPLVAYYLRLVEPSGEPSVLEAFLAPYQPIRFSPAEGVSLIGQLAFTPYCFVVLAGERDDVALNRCVVFSEKAVQRIRDIAFRLAACTSFLPEQQFNAAVRWHSNQFDMKQLTYS